MKIQIIILSMFCLVSCKSGNETRDASEPTDALTGLAHSSTETLEQMNKRLQNQLQEEEKLKADFSKNYQRYRCEENDVPLVEDSTGPGRSFRSMQFGDHLALKLDLGALIRVNGTESGPMRTKSRYRLLWDGTRVADAESLYSVSTATGDEGGSNRFTYNPSTQSLLVFEEFCWSTMRYIFFQRSNDSKWTAKYFWPPSRPIFGSPVNRHGKIRGIGNGKVYVEVDGQMYAFPVDDFLVKALEFTVG